MKLMFDVSCLPKGPDKETFSRKMKNTLLKRMLIYLSRNTLLKI